MIKLNSICERLEDVMEKLQLKVDTIETNAEEKGRGITEREEKRIDDMLSEIDAIECALDYLRDYAE